MDIATTSRQCTALELTDDDIGHNLIWGEGRNGMELREILAPIGSHGVRLRVLITGKGESIVALYAQTVLTVE